MPVSETSFSELINKPKATLQPLIAASAHAVLDLLPEVFPWTRFLPAGDRHTF
ncbi:hypothetical protein Ade02nite_49140 [Paractinoplanes deccanensis]|uniref:Uncharacterized protein n=1 Tax=Paractinoplanes deccanensis TaxID=113561 RepID=A0ABQ3Y8F0_9ACTN|nr:hypothetical protein [Actinoplanes deccanensis]GID76273.1 hypothetical protein Ade02nite_49140 [Actinoplanes deccanensis]